MREVHRQVPYGLPDVTPAFLKTHSLKPPSDLDAYALPQSECEEVAIQMPAPEPYEDGHATKQTQFESYARGIIRAKLGLAWRFNVRVIQHLEYAELIRALSLHRFGAASDPETLAFSTAVLSVMLLGFSPIAAARLRLQGASLEATEGSAVALSYFPMTNCICYEWPKSWLGYTAGDSHFFLNYTIPTTRWVRLSLFPPLSSLYRLCHEHVVARVSSTATPYALYEMLHSSCVTPDVFLTKADAWLASLEPNARTGHRWTLSRLSQSFFIHATQDFAIDPVVASYMSAQYPFPVRSQLQYTALPGHRITADLRRLHQGWYEALAASLAQIATASDGELLNWWHRIVGRPSQRGFA